MPSTPPETGQPDNRWPVIWMLTANLISNLGNTVTALAIPWFVLQTTGSAGKMGIVAAASLAPMVVSTFIGGTLTDRMSHRQLATLADVLSGVSVAAIPALHFTVGLNLVTLIGLVFLGAIFDGPGMNARQAMIPKLADRAGMSLERVNSGFGIGRSLMSLLGAPVAGAVIALAGAASALWVTAATFAVSAAITRLLLPATARPEPSGASMLADMKDGLRYLFGNRLLRSIALTATILNMVLSPVFAIGLPVYITDMGRDAGTLGILMTSVAAGSLAGSLVYGWLGERLPPRATVIATLLMLTLPLFGMATRPGLVTMWLLLFVIDFGGGVINPLVVSFFHRHTPERMLGRALGTLMSTAILASPLGMLLGGALIATQGFGVAVLAGGIAMLAVAVPLALNGALADLSRPVSPAAEAA
jgi:MFS family permease